MTREEAKEMLPIIQAYAEGKTIQIYDDVEEVWIDINFEDPRFEGIPSYYRIKPEPKYRPFKTQEECWEEMLKHQPFGWIKRINGNDLFRISSVNCGGITTLVYYRFSISFEQFTFIDGTPFGIKEE